MTINSDKISLQLSVLIKHTRYIIRKLYVTQFKNNKWLQWIWSSQKAHVLHFDQKMQHGILKGAQCSKCWENRFDVCFKSHLITNSTHSSLLQNVSFFCPPFPISFAFKTWLIWWFTRFNWRSLMVKILFSSSQMLPYLLCISSTCFYFRFQYFAFVAWNINQSSSTKLLACNLSFENTTLLNEYHYRTFRIELFILIINVEKTQDHAKDPEESSKLI